jgi:hypothetical protein
MSVDTPNANRVLRSIAAVVDQAKFVVFDKDAAVQFVKELIQDGPPTPPAWDTEHHFFDDSERTVHYLLLLDSLNFCFWANPRWSVKYNETKLVGYKALAAALKAAMERGVPLDDARFLCQIDREQMEDIIQSKGQIPLVEERAAITREVGMALIRHHRGKVVNLLEAAKGSAWRVIDFLIADFPNFRDVAYYGPRQVMLLKRAQIFCADLYSAFKGEKWGAFHDIDQLTAFADYRLPQILRKHGVLFFSPDLADRVDNMELIQAGSEEEVEIRALTIHAVEKLKEILAEKGCQMKTIEVDWILWNKTRGLDVPPFHRTLTTFY